MKRFLLGLFLSLFVSAALAQGCGPTNPNCIVPTRPVGDSTNAAASTAFVTTGVANILTTPNTWTALQTFNGGLASTVGGCATNVPPTQTTPVATLVAICGTYADSTAGNIFQISSWADNTGTRPTVALFGQGRAQGVNSKAFGINGVAYAGAVNAFAQNEFDFGVSSGISNQQAFGLSINVGGCTNCAGGTGNLTAGLNFDSLSLGTYTLPAIRFNNFGIAQPYSAALIATGNAGGALTGPTGIDFSNANFSTAAIKTNGFTVSPTGGVAGAATGVFTNTQQNDFSTFLLNGIVPSTEFTTHQGGNFATEALAVGVLVPNTNTAYQVNGIASYVKSNAAQVSTGGYVAGYFSSFANANNANMFGLNPVVGDVGAGLTGVHLQNEFDFSPANAATQITGLALVMGGTVTPTVANGFVVQASVGRQWGGAFFSSDGAAFQGMYLGANSTANNVNSQQLVFGGRDSGGTLHKPTINSDPNGVLQFNSGALAVGSGGTGDTGTAWTAFTPSPSCGTATFTVNSARSKTLGKTTWIDVDISFTAIGTCTNGQSPAFSFTLPNVPNITTVITGREVVNNSGMTSCSLSSGTSAVSSCVKQSAALVNWAAGGTDRMIISGTYENQ
jgi:hypothetical protein